MADFLKLVKKFGAGRLNFLADAFPASLPAAHEKRPHAAAVPGYEWAWNYQAATTAPLYLVSMNCFTAGL